jgi:hypothetical protein
VGGVEQADRQLVADVRPRDFAAQLDVETVTLVEAEDLREQHGRAVDQGNEPHSHLRSLDVTHQTRLQKKRRPKRPRESDRVGRRCPERQTAIGLPLKFRRRPSLGVSLTRQQEPCQAAGAPRRSAKRLILLENSADALCSAQITSRWL